MTAGIELKPEEKNLFDSINNSVKLLRDYYRDVSQSQASQDVEEKIREVCGEMAAKAHALHMMLKGRGKEPKHHKYMIKNRGVSVEDKEFYKHLHPVEDLISFIHNPDANSDPEDSTMGKSFDFSVFTRRWGRYDHYKLIRTEKGWKIVGGLPNSQRDMSSDKKGDPYVYAVLDHDFVNYPHHIGLYLEMVWNSAAKGADKEEVQQALNNIAEWISFCEKASPHSGILGDGI